MTSKAYRTGTHRALAPEETLARVRPLLREYGVTRLADVTGLDSLGIPTYCAIRPAAATVQVSNGKGSRPVDAQVSALMEAIECACGEGPPCAEIIVRSPAELEAAGERWSLDLPAHAAPARPPPGRIEWARGVDLASGASAWLPAATAWIRPRQAVPYDWSGLASGNTLVEATLHALYEVLERHILSGLVAVDRLDFSTAEVIDPATCDDATVADLWERIVAGGVRLVLLHVPSPLAVHAFMAVLLDPEPFGGASAVNVGYGAHLSPSVAAARAVTEAAQSRLTFIHGAREDLRKETYQHGPTHARLFEFFDAMRPAARWGALADASGDDLESDLAAVLATMQRGGLTRAWRIDMSPPDAPFAVAKVVVPEALLTIPV